MTGDDVDERLERAAARIAHELRNPLTVIAGYAELLRVRDDEATRLEAAEAIREAAHDLLAKLDNVLALGREEESP